MNLNKSERGGFATIVAIIIGLIVIGGGVYVYDQSVEENLTPKEQVDEYENNLEEVPTETVVADYVRPDADDTSHDLGVKEFNVYFSKATCSKGEGFDSTCLVVNGSKFYDNILGFDYEEGYTYTLSVEKTLAPNYKDILSGQLADASIYEYELIEIIKKENALCFQVKSHQSETKIYFPTTITGTIDNTSPYCNWGKGEGEGGSAQMFFNHNNEGWKELSTPQIIDVGTDWMDPVVDFSVTLDFNNGGMGLLLDTPVKLIFSENIQKDGEVAQTYEMEFTLDY